MKRRIRLTEGDLRKIVNNSVRRCLREMYYGANDIKSMLLNGDFYGAKRVAEQMGMDERKWQSLLYQYGGGGDPEIKYLNKKPMTDKYGRVPFRY